MAKAHDTNSAPPLQGTFLPTPDIIEGWKAERARIRAKIDSLQQRHDNFDAIILAAERLMPEADIENTPASPLREMRTQTRDVKKGRPTALVRPADKTWTATINGILLKLGRATYDELRVEVSKTHLAKKLAQTDKSFYGAIAKLVAQDAVVRHNGWLFSSATYSQLMKDITAGRAVDEEAPKNNAQQSPFGEAIKAFMDTMPTGAPSAEIMRELRKTPEFADTMERHKSHFYNVLSRLVDQGELAKGGGKYFRAPNKQGGQA